jgi:AraC-like DNA-binding protein
MPSSVVRTFSDPDDFAAAIRGTNAELTITGRGRFAAKLIRVDLHRLWMQRYFESLPRVLHTALQPSGRAIISFRTRPGPSILARGVEVKPCDISRLSGGHQGHLLTSGELHFASMSIPVEDMASTATTMAGCNLAPPRNALFVTATPVAMAKLLRLSAAAAHLAETAPEIIANPDAARGLEQALLEAMVDCLGNDEPREDRVAQRQHELIMRRFRRVVEENPDQPLYIPEFCKAIGVSQRTLQVCCQEQLGLGPKRYLLLRRLNLARRAMREASADAVTVTEVAMRHGFWHLGRFAGEYQSLFGEPPSSTLHRPAE